MDERGKKENRLKQNNMTEEQFIEMLKEYAQVQKVKSYKKPIKAREFLITKQRIKNERNKIQRKRLCR